MPAQVGVELLRELRNARYLPPYHAESVDAIAAEVNEQFAVVQAGVAQMRDESEQRQQQQRTHALTPQRHAQLAGNLLVHKACMLRNKRCALAYLVNRLQRLERVRWEAPALLEREVAERASADELAWLERYDDLLAWYCDEVELDLTVELLPPKELYIEVRVLEDCGTLQPAAGRARSRADTSDTAAGDDDNGHGDGDAGGGVRLEVGTMHYVRRRDVEPLIRQGKLEHVTR